MAMFNQQFPTRKILSAVAFSAIFAFIGWISYARVFRPQDNFLKDLVDPRIKQKQSERARASDAVRNALVANPEQFGVSSSDLHTIRTDNSVPSAKPGVRYVYLTQEVNGIPVQNAQLRAVAQTASAKSSGFHPDSRRKLVQDEDDEEFKSVTVSSSSSDGLVSNVEECINSKEPKLSAEDAVLNAASHVLGISPPLPTLIMKDDASKEIDSQIDDADATRKTIFEPVDEISTIDISCQLAYWKDTNNDCDIYLSWEIIARPNNTHWLQMIIDANSGSPIHVTNWVRSAATFSAVPFAKESPLPTINLDNINITEPIPFNVNELQSLSLASNPVWSGSSLKNNDWLRIGDIAFDETQGNNVRVVVDLDENSTDYFNSGRTAMATDPSQSMFDYSYQNISSNKPEDWTDAAIVNVFYWTNIMHDILYEYGFDEESGNFQEDNFGLGGLGGDSVIVEVQDRGAIDNAVFLVTPDGYRPVMQLFLFNRTDADLIFEVNSERYHVMPALFGATDYNIVGATVIDSNGTECNSESDGDYSDFIVVIDRGNCTFIEKVKNAQDKGAVAVVIVDNVEGNIFLMQGDDESIVIPAVSMTKSDGEMLKASLPTDQSVLSLDLNSAEFFVRDSAFDSGVIVHEYCHGLSTRLTGGPNAAYCVDPTFYPESGSEGWSDFCALFATATNETGRTRTIGSYASWDINGIRVFPYSPNFDINPSNYSYVNYMTGVAASESTHFIGTIFATILWDMYWAIIDEEESNGSLGFNENKYQSGVGGSNIAMLLVVESLKLQPCQPSFVDSRDAILSADENLYNGKYHCLIWSTFARRGLGYSAKASPMYIVNATAGFDLPPQCLGPYLSLVSWDLDISSGDGDKFLDNCETAVLTLRVENSGIGDLTNIQLVDFSSMSSATIEPKDSLSSIEPSTLSEGDVGEVTISFTANGLSMEEPLILEVVFTATELIEPIDMSVTIDNTAIDFLFTDSLTWDFRDGGNNFTVIEGLFYLEPYPILLEIGGVSYTASGAAFGPQTFDIHNLTIIEGTDLGCFAVDDNDYNNSIVIVNRGTCTFSVKAKNAQDRGAQAVIIANNFDDPTITMEGFDPSISIPSVMISLQNASDIRAAMPTSTTALVRSNDTMLSSSAFLPNMCDRVISPTFLLHEDSSIEIMVNYDIEYSFQGEWFDRANIGLFDGESRIVVSPDLGDLYRASGTGPFVTCAVSGEDGFAGSTNGLWKSSMWSANVLRAANLTDKVVQIDVAYGTDMMSHGKGISIEKITLNNVSTLVADAETQCSEHPAQPSPKPTDANLDRISMSPQPTSFPSFVPTGNASKINSQTSTPLVPTSFPSAHPTPIVDAPTPSPLIATPNPSASSLVSSLTGAKTQTSSQPSSHLKLINNPSVSPSSSPTSSKPTPMPTVTASSLKRPSNIEEIGDPDGVQQAETSSSNDTGSAHITFIFGFSLCIMISLLQ